MAELKDPGRDPAGNMVRASSQYLGHGMALAASVALFGWIGSKVGQRVGAEAVLTLLGMLLGGAAGFYSIYLQLVVRPRQKQEPDSGWSEED